MRRRARGPVAAARGPPTHPGGRVPAPTHPCTRARHLNAFTRRVAAGALLAAANVSGLAKRVAAGAPLAAVIVSGLAGGFASPAAAWGHAGEAVCAFAGLDPEPVGSALAGTHVAAVSGASAVGWNAAGLARDVGSRMAVAHATLPGGASLEWICLSLRLPGRGGGLGLAAGVLRTGSLSGFTEEGTPDGEFHPRELTLRAAHGLPLGQRGRLGYGVELLHEGGDGGRSLTAVGFSAGWQWRVGPMELGMAGLHLGPAVLASGERHPLPASVRFGASTRPVERLDLHGAADTGEGRPWRASLGAAWRPVAVIEGLGGLRWDLEDAGSARLQPSLGLVLHTRHVSVAYRFAPSELAASHQVSLAVPQGR